jgi:hypothetical protein
MQPPTPEDIKRVMTHLGSLGRGASKRRSLDALRRAQAASVAAIKRRKIQAGRAALGIDPTPIAES